MNPFADFLIKNFFLFCLTLAVIFMVTRSYRQNRIEVFIPIMVVSLCLLLSILYFIETQTAKNEDLVFLTTFCCALGFILRPFLLYLFMRMTINKKIILIIANSLIFVNGIIYTLSLFLFAPELTHVIFYYQNGVAIRGPLFYSCHGIIGVMTICFVAYAILSIKGIHRYDALSSMICGLFVAIAVVLEAFLVAEYLLNTTIAISVLFYVVHLYQQASVHDALTNLFDRKAYYYDLSKIESKVTGFISVDINSLKWINDNQGHHEGDMAIKTVANIILESLDSKHMDAYRMGGDEFIILSTSSRKATIKNTVNNIVEKVSKTPYHIALGYAIKDNDEITVKQMCKIAETMMYEDKSNYYKTEGRDRRGR